MEVNSIKMESTHEILVHHGILGMKWGIRRTPEELGHRRPSSRLKKKRSSDSNDILEDVDLANRSNRSEWSVNGFQSVLALEMRRRGYDVEAKSTDDGADGIGTMEQYERCFKNIKVKSAIYTDDDPNKDIKELKNAISKEGNNARGYVSYMPYGFFYGSSVMYATDSNGNVTFYDPQTGKHGKSVEDILKDSTQWYEYGRLDNCEFDSSIMDYVRNRR